MNIIHAPKNLPLVTDKMMQGSERVKLSTLVEGDYFLSDYQLTISGKRPQRASMFLSLGKTLYQIRDVVMLWEYHINGAEDVIVTKLPIK